MNAATLIPAVLFYYDRDGQLREAETRAAEQDCDAVSGAALLIGGGRPAMVRVEAAAAVRDTLREMGRGGEG